MVSNLVEQNIDNQELIFKNIGGKKGKKKSGKKKGRGKGKKKVGILQSPRKRKSARKLMQK